MSMPVNNIRPMLLSPLPLVILVASVCIVIWLITQTNPLPTGRRLPVHQALQNIPEEDIEKHLSKIIATTNLTRNDPFFRSPTPQRLEPTTSTEAIDAVADFREIQLTTIAHGKLGSYCLVNGNIYHEGRNGDGFTVELISPGEVVFSTPAQTFTMVPGEKVTLEEGKIRMLANETSSVNIEQDKSHNLN